MSNALLVLVVFVVGWFGVGTAVNVRRGNATLKWLQGGLKLLGDKATVRWLGTTAVHLVLARAKPPFEEAAVVVFLEPRDLPWLWAPSRFRGRRDTLILRGRLAKPPAMDVELLDRESWSGRDALRGMKDERWSVREPSAPGSLPAFYKFENALGKGDALLGLALQAGMTVRRLAVRRNEPHLTLHVDLPAASVDAAAFFGTFCVLGRQAAQL